MRPIVIHKEEILELLDFGEIILEVEQGFVAFSEGRAQIPPPQNLFFETAEGEAHIKSAAIENHPFWCVKIASGFYSNLEKGLHPSQGMMSLLDSETGQVVAVLLEDGQLTDFRTAAAGAIAAKYLAKKDSKNIMVVGTGTQAKLQIEFLSTILEIESVHVLGRSRAKELVYSSFMDKKGLHTRPYEEKNADKIDIIVTTTPTRIPIVVQEMISAGVHINAMGSDMPGKREISANVLPMAKVVTDSTDQCGKNGELQHALNEELLSEMGVYAQIGEIISGAKPGRMNDREITLFDSTGLGVQDLAIAGYVYGKYLNRQKSI